MLLENLNPVEHWFFILANLTNFAGKPEEIGARYAAVAEAARIHLLPEQDLLNYMNAMVSEEEKQDIGAAYYEDGLQDGLVKGREEGLMFVAKNMLAAGMDVEQVARLTGLKPEDLPLAHK